VNGCLQAAGSAKRAHTKMIRFAIGILCGVLLLSACKGGRPTRPEGSAGDPYLILAKELEASKQNNVYDAVRQLRPFWFSRRVAGRTGENAISIYIEDQLVGTLSSLRRVSVFGTARVRYMSATEAQTRFGQLNQSRAAILVELER
jgi:hypothetical protein